MENDAEFEDENSGHLRGVVFVAEAIGDYAVFTESLCVWGGNVLGYNLVVVDVVAAVAHVVFATGVAKAVGGACSAVAVGGVGGLMRVVVVEDVVMGV